MSDLYLVLRHRLDDVRPDWVLIESTVMRRAREQRGLSYEAMGRLLNVASKTYERYEKAGRVPKPMLARLAEVLDLEIDEPARERVRVTPTSAADEGDLAGQVAVLRRQLERVLEILEDPDRREGDPRAAAG